MWFRLWRTFVVLWMRSRPKISQKPSKGCDTLWIYPGLTHLRLAFHSVTNTRYYVILDSSSYKINISLCRWHPNHLVSHQMVRPTVTFYLYIQWVLTYVHQTVCGIYVSTSQSDKFRSLWLYLPPFLIVTGHISPVEESMSLLTEAVYSLVKLYVRSFCPPSASFRSPPLPQPGKAFGGRSSKEASGTTDHLQFTVFAVHGIPASWVSR